MGIASRHYRGMKGRGHWGGLVRVGVLMLLTASLSVAAYPQASPGPYEIMPYEDGYITEAFKDLLFDDSSNIADWTGWISNSWESPNAYNGHGGTDTALDTGTPLYAPCAGQVIEVVTNIPENNHTMGYYGNYVKIHVTSGLSPDGQALDVILAHQLPQVQVTVGQNVVTGQLIGYSDNTGQSTSEHLHFESLPPGASDGDCPFYYGHFKYPIMFNPSGTKQFGHVIQVTAASTPIREDRFDTSPQITTAYQDQLYFCSYWKRGYYRVFIPNDSANRSGFIRATDAVEVFTGTVIQALPDPGAYVHTQTLAGPHAIKASPDAGSATLGQIVYGGGRFVADQVQSGWYRIPLPGASATWGWVQADSRLLVYPQLYNPALNLGSLPNNDFPLTNSFATLGGLYWGRPKYNRSFVQNFSPASPGGDGKVLLITDANTYGNGYEECVSVGKVNHRNYYVEADVYFDYDPSYFAKKEGQMYGVFARDDGFASMDRTFEGKGNCYALLYDSEKGQVQAGKIVDANVTDFLPSSLYVTTDGWNHLRIECEEDHIRYYLNGNLLVDAVDTEFPCGPCGMGYVFHYRSGYPSERGARFDNFSADALTVIPTPSPSPTLTPSPSPTDGPTATPSPSPSPTSSGDVPAAPSNLTADAISKSQIDLAWQDNSSNEVSFVIERSTNDNSNFATIDTVPANTTSYQDTGLDRRTTYYYRVKAANASGDSDYSNEAWAKTLNK